MNKISTFLFGFVLGGGFVYMTLHYHVIRANDGMHLVAKTTSTFSESYVDIRAFGPAEWNGHRNVANAIVQANKPELLQGALVNPINNAVGGVLDRVNEAAQSTGFQFEPTR